MTERHLTCWVPNLKTLSGDFSQVILLVFLRVEGAKVLQGSHLSGGRDQKNRVKQLQENQAIMLKNFTFGWAEPRNEKTFCWTLCCNPPPMLPHTRSPSRLRSRFGVDRGSAHGHGWRQKSIITNLGFSYFEVGILESQGRAWETSMHSLYHQPTPSCLQGISELMSWSCS